MTPIISIITVNLNDSFRLRKTLKSILGQSSLDFEWLVIDGNSKDGSVEILDDHLRDERLSYLIRNPAGIYDAMNYGIQMSKGEFCWFINCGDVLMTCNSVEDAIESLKRNKFVNIFSPVLHLSNKERMLDLSLPEMIEDNGKFVALTNHQGVLAAKKDLISCGLFDVNLKYAADGKLLDSLCSTTEIAITNTVWVGFEMGGTAASNFKETYEEISTYRKINLSRVAIRILNSRNMLRLYSLRLENNKLGSLLTNLYFDRKERSVIDKLHKLEIMIK